MEACTSEWACAPALISVQIRRNPASGCEIHDSCVALLPPSILMKVNRTPWNFKRAIYPRARTQVWAPPSDRRDNVYLDIVQCLIPHREVPSFFSFCPVKFQPRPFLSLSCTSLELLSRRRWLRKLFVLSHFQLEINSHAKEPCLPCLPITFLFIIKNEFAVIKVTGSLIKNWWNVIEINSAAFVHYARIFNRD